MSRINETHRKFIRSLNCAACGAADPECAHVSIRHFGSVTIPYSEQKFKGKNGKTHDKWTVPLCRGCHQMQHTWGERRFWELQHINPLELASALWHHTGKRTPCLNILLRRRNEAGDL